VPGVILLLAGILIVSGQVLEAELATLLILGGVFFIRGFNLDRALADLLHRGPTGYMRLFSSVSSFLVILAGVFTGYGYLLVRDPSDVAAVGADPSQFLVHGATLVGYFISGSLILIWAGIAIYSTGALLSHVARDSIRWRRDGFVLLMLGLLYFPISTFSTFLIQGGAEESFLLISYVLLGLAAIFALTVTIYPRVRPRGATQKE